MPSSTKAVLKAQQGNRWLPPLISLAFVLGAWEAGVRIFDIKPYLLPGPRAVFAAFLEHTESLTDAGLFTLKVSLLAFVVVLTLGTLLALALASSEWASRAFYPYAVMLQSTPVIAVAPLIIIWFGLGTPSIVAIGCMISIFAVIASTTAGLRGVDQPLKDVFALYGASRMQTLLKLQLPYALPSMVTGWRIAGAQVVVGAIVGEYMAGAGGGSHGGLGLIIAETSARLQTAYLLAAALTAALMGVLFFALVNLAGYLLLRKWHDSEVQGR
jgi:NitT/TauT family transport system permease protein